MHINTGRTSQGVEEVIPGQDWHQESGVNGRDGMVFIWSLVKSIMVWTRRQDNIGWIVEVDSVEGILSEEAFRGMN